MAKDDNVLTQDRVLTGVITRGTRSLDEVAEKVGASQEQLPQVKDLLTKLLLANEVFMTVGDGRWEYGRVRARGRGLGGRKGGKR